GALVDEPARRAAVSQRLKSVGDLERLTSRAALGVAHARDLVGLRGFLGQLPALRDDMAAVGASLARAIGEDIVGPPGLQKRLEEGLGDEPPLPPRGGGPHAA